MDDIVIIPGAGCCPLPEGWLERERPSRTKVLVGDPLPLAPANENRLEEAVGQRGTRP